MTDETNTNREEEQTKEKAPQDGGAAETPKTKPEKTYTKAEVEAMIQERLDREKKAAERRAGIEKLEGEDRLKAQYDLDRETLTKERDEAQKELRIAKAGVALSKLGLSPDIAPTLIGPDDETTQANIDNFAKLVNDQVQAVVASKMARGAPKVPGNAPDSKSNKLRDEVYGAARVNQRKE